MESSINNKTALFMFGSEFGWKKISHLSLAFVSVRRRQNIIVKITVSLLKAFSRLCNGCGLSAGGNSRASLIFQEPGLMINVMLHMRRN